MLCWILIVGGLLIMPCEIATIFGSPRTDRNSTRMCLTGIGKIGKTSSTGRSVKGWWSS